VTGPERLAKFELLQFAGGGASELGAELDALRALVTGELGAYVRDEIGLGELGPGRADHETHHEFTPLLVGDSDDGDLAHLGMTEDGVLHLDGRDVLATRDDDVLLAIADGDVVVVVDDPPVARVEPLDPARVVARRVDGVGGGLGAATYSLATRFMPSRSGVTTPIRAMR